MKKYIAFISLGLFSWAHAQTPASAPYTPSWQARHQLQLLVDHAGLDLPLTHWPLPAAAVAQAIAELPSDLSSSVVDLHEARAAVLKELEQREQQANVRLQVRNRAEGLTGFDENYTPGSSAQLVSEEKRKELGSVSVAGRLGLRVENASNALQSAFSSGSTAESRYPVRLEGSAAVLGWEGWNFQAFSHRHWWGPGWQSSLINGSNVPAWNGFGVQRGTVKPSDSPWLNWMGPWNLDVFVARAQDPVVVTNQSSGYLFSGARLTMRPQPWLEVGLSRGLQTAGAGRPSGLNEFVKAFFGQQTNKDAADAFQDSSNQIAGYDVRLRCPQALGPCALYTQWMGEDSAGKYPPLPYRFMKLFGAETSYGQGQYRVFAEYSDTNVPRLMAAGTEPAYFNSYYPQGYTNGGRWIGSAQGGGSKVTTLGWMDAQNQRMVKLHVGKVLWSVGSGYPDVNSPHGNLKGMSASQTLKWQGLTWTPEISWVRLSEGADVEASKRNNVRLGVTVLMPL